MNRVRVKIEGLRDVEMAVAVAQMGADAVGLVFAPSPRQVEPQRAAQIVAALGPWVSTVGVFVNANADEINDIVRLTGIGYVQLHGDEPPELVHQIEARCIKAFRVRNEGWAGEVVSWLDGLGPRRNFSAVLLDAYDPLVRGGSGKQFNWSWIERSRQRGEMDAMGPIILAGGLNGDNVAAAIETVKPWAVDVASGVESSPGVKDLDRVMAFLEAAVRSS
jgi:phosphoribosylanthranilate isomerase